MTELSQIAGSGGRMIAEAWHPLLADVSLTHGQTTADWDIVYPGVLALVGFQGQLWPLWHRTTEREATGLGIKVEPARALLRYSEPGADAREVWRFDYSAVAHDVAWAAFGGPGMTDFDTVRAILSDRHVLQTLTTLDGSGKVVMTGYASSRLEPLLNARLKGDVPIGLPVCSCTSAAEVIRPLSDSLARIFPVIRDTARAVAEWSRENSNGCVTSEWSDLVRTSYAFLAWHAWQCLCEHGIVPQAAADSAPRKRWLGLREGPRRAFKGIVLLHGDHWQLWRSVRASAGVDACPRD